MAYLIKDYSMSPFIKKNIAIAFLGAFFFLFSTTTALADALPLTSGSGATITPPPSAITQANNLLGTITCELKNIPGCLMKLPTFGLVYLSYFIYILAAGILAISGYLFDAVLSLSIDSTFISKPFVDSTWTIVRDFSNMLFIFILIYTGVLTILGEKNWAKTIKNVIIIALLINFSLFFTKVVIDAGNTLAVGVYGAIGVEKTDKIHTSGAVVERDLSAAIVSNFGPQTILGNVGKIESAYLVFAVFLIGTAVNLLAAWAFFRVALLFIGRIIGFWFLMIISPFAFISIALPKGNIFNKWLDTLLELSFVAPVFLFMLYIIMQVLAGGQLLSSLSSPSGASLAEFSFDAIFIPVVMVIFIYLALDKTINLTKSLSGDFGDIGTKIGGAVLGVTAGAVLSGTALAGRGLVGGYAAESLRQGVKTEDELSKMTPEERARYQKSRARLQTLTQASFDVRSLAGEKSVFGKTVGGMISKGGGAFGVNVGKATLGGVEKAAKDADKKATDNVPKLSIFEEQEIARRAIEQAAKNQEELPALEEFLKTATDATKEQEKLIETAKGQSAEEIRRREAEYKIAQERAEKNRGTENESPEDLRAVVDAKNAIDKAKSDQEIAMKPLMADLERAKNKQKEAEKSIKDAKKDAKTIAEDNIKAENDRRRKAYADKIERNEISVPFIGETGLKKVWKNTHTANKIRKGEESSHAKKAKELAEELKKAKEEGKHEAVIKDIEEKIEKNKKNS